MSIALGAASCTAEDTPRYNATDVHFLGMMVPHHEQAIEMSDILLDSPDADPQVRDLAQRIRDGQARENDQMRTWADEWGEHEAMEFHSQHIANGMVMPDELEALKTLRGDELETQFLELMHIHHADVIAMTQGEVDEGEYAPLQEMAEDMIEVQTAEMGEMEDMLGFVPRPAA
ncbi:DUF305 domain-containing protein [Corynebacterium breve]|uniref:DUF305 domain-containing protein n=1 Tax=Corynebacterium breve TaxID=3049799 RepID=A0ABY8VDQ4_9CORY|nr:DUF305 domain-containing protein [Corynebacterium breve]WIM67237.1 DUF305 domain-containing protein [Corynebacterium breve]